MSGFDKEWLSLREPVDREARDQALVQKLASHLAGLGEAPGLMDIGCGTGSTWRTLSPVLPQTSQWQLLDYDQTLLDEARGRIGSQQTVSFRQHDLNDLAGLSLAGVHVVTASALFDLCAAEFCDRFVRHLAERRVGLYAALNYDGKISWNAGHPLDNQAVSDFNRHQRTDKGFGPALGPDATGVLRDLLERHGYQVSIADSPWTIDAGHPALHRAFVSGFDRPLQEIGSLSESDFSDWTDFRLDHATRSDALCVVGHQDLLALPK